MLLLPQIVHPETEGKQMKNNGAITVQPLPEQDAIEFTVTAGEQQLSACLPGEYVAELIRRLQVFQHIRRHESN